MKNDLLDTFKSGKTHGVIFKKPAGIIESFDNHSIYKFVLKGLAYPTAIRGERKDMELFLNVAESLEELLEDQVKRIDIQWSDKYNDWTAYIYFEKRSVIQVTQEGRFYFDKRR